MVDEMATATKRLSPRHRECLALVFKLRTSKDIAAELGIGVGTVNSYIGEAVSLLGARNRRHAAELLFSAEAATPPEKFDPTFAGVASLAVQPQPSGTNLQSSDVLVLLPFRSSGAKRNAFQPVRRLFWILQIVFAFAISFGMLLIGLEVLSRMFGGS
jgi:DNA-binding CsgD family transcriptional regulator